MGLELVLTIHKAMLELVFYRRVSIKLRSWRIRLRTDLFSRRSEDERDRWASGGGDTPRKGTTMEK